MRSHVIARNATMIGLLVGGISLVGCAKEEPTPTPMPAISAAPAEPVAVTPPAPAPKPVVTKAALVADDADTAKAKTLLSPGTDVDIAFKGFASRQQFYAVAYASKNLKVPFMVLKDKVVDKKMTLTKAISTSKSGVDPKLEATRAEAEAKAELAKRKLTMPK